MNTDLSKDKKLIEELKREIDSHIVSHKLTICRVNEQRCKAETELADIKIIIKENNLFTLLKLWWNNNV